MDLFKAMPASIVCLALLSTAPSQGQEAVAIFVPRMFKGKAGLSMPYRLFVPAADVRVVPLPAVVYLHGSGGAGKDNLSQISGGNTSGTHLWTSEQVQPAHPSFVVVPQLPTGDRWNAPGPELAPYGALVVELLASLSQEFSIDQDRVYLVGQSLGGYGTWDVISKRPNLFAAAVPLCGGGDPARITAARGVAIWAFHGARDDIVPVTNSREMVAALRAVGSPVKYTEYTDIGHAVWTVAFAERDLPDWLFAQRRGGR
jgi:predicted peptidase